jgi:hypothetical protein
MATVNLGSIKFKWKGTYSGATAYTVDDVVEYNGSSYICKLASTGNLPTNTTYFDVMSQAGTDGTDVGTTLTTQGDILYRDGSGLQRLGAGTSGQVLQTGGAGANPSWGTVSSDYVKILSSDITSSTAYVDLDNIFSSSDGYNNYEIVIKNITPENDGQPVYARYLDSTGSVISSADYVWYMGGGEVASTQYNNGQYWAAYGGDYMALVGAGGNVDNHATAGGVGITLQLFNCADSLWPHLTQQHSFTRGTSSDNFMSITGGATLRQATSVRGIRFFFGSGNVAKGNFRVYGRK